MTQKGHKLAAEKAAGIGILFIAIAGAFIAQEMRRVEEVKRSGTA